MAETEIERLSDTLIEIGGKVRVEQGPELKTAEATEELLDDKVTASHYHAPVEKTHAASGKTVKVYAKDALGQRIEIGSDMTYLDWLGDRVWYVYVKQWEEVLDASGTPVSLDGEPQMIERWVEVETLKGSEDEAIERATAILDDQE